VLNGAPHLRQSVTKYSIRIKNKKMDESEVDASVVNNGNERYINLAIDCSGPKGEMNRYFSPNVMANLSVMNFSIKENGKLYTATVFD